jgi:hypothetical protein
VFNRQVKNKRLASLGYQWEFSEAFNPDVDG